MNTGKRGNILLVELLIVIFFFMIGSVILMQVFEKSYMQSRKADAQTQALSEGQSIADRLYLAEDASAELEKLGFVQDGQEQEGESAFLWTKEADPVTFSYGYDMVNAENGVIRKGTLTAMYKGEELFSLPCTRYLNTGSTETQ